MSSNKLGVIHGCVALGGTRRLERRGMVTHLEDEPASEVDAADWLRPIRKPWGKRMLRNPSKAERGEKGDEEQRGKHRRLWQMAKGSGGGRGKAGKGRGDGSEKVTICYKRRKSNRCREGNALF